MVESAITSIANGRVRPVFTRINEKGGNRRVEIEEWSYHNFLYEFSSYELKRREEKLIERRLKWAAFPVYKTLDDLSIA